MARRHTVHQQVVSRKAPKPLGAYSQAVKVENPGEMLFVSGQLPIEVPSGRVFTGDIKKQAQITFANVRNLIIDAKFSMDEVVRVVIYLTDLKDYEVVNTEYAKMFVGASLPARAVVQVAALGEGVSIEVEAMAVKKGKSMDEIFKDEDFK